MKIPRLLAAMLVVASFLGSACGSGSEDGDSASEVNSDRTLTLAFSSDMEDPDPDTVYQLQGNQVMTSLYEGLLDYAPDSSSELVPLLAEDWSVSDDQLTYTFTLREGLTFSDGTPLDSTTLKAGFERRVAENVAAPAAYMLAGVESYETPDPLTFIINLSAPDSAFPTYLASSVSPKAINPKVLEDNAEDSAVEFMKTQSAGTGPYVLEEFTRGQQYVLSRNENYWGEEPFYEKVVVKIIPDAASQIVQLQGGDLDIVAGQPIATVRTFEDSEDFQVVTFPVLQKAWLHLNVHSGPTADPEIRRAIRAAIDRPALVEQVFGDYAPESTQMYPVENLPEGMATDEWEFEPSVLEQLGDTPIRLSYSASLAADQQVVETIQTQLQAAGATVELVPLQDGEQYAFVDDLEGAPNMHYEVAYPDSNHPDTWARLFWYSDVESGGGGFLNYMVGGTPEADSRMNEGISATDPGAVDEAYGEVGDLIQDSANWITLADPEDVFIVRDGITGFQHWLPTPFALQLKALKPE